MMKTTILGLVLVALAGVPAAAADLAVDDDFPVVGKPISVSISDADGFENLELRVVYAPNSETQSIEEIGRFSPEGTVVWNPRRFGIATLSVRTADGEKIASENVAILFAETPAAGVLVMIFAGILLFGGAGISLRSVLSSGVPEHGSPIDT